jgi:aminopeptidase N
MIMSKVIWQVIFTFLFLLSGNLVLKGEEFISPISHQSDKDNYDILFYHLDLNVSDSSTYIQGAVSITLKSTIPALQQVTLDLSNLLMLDSVIINNQRCQYYHSLNELNIDLNAPAAMNEDILVKVYYHGLGKYSYVPAGIYNKYISSWDKNITWTLSEPFSAMYWFPCKQSLTDKADSVYVFLSTDSRLKAGSNGLLTAQVPLPDNRIRYEWKSRFPIAYYLISFTTSDYMDYSFYVKTRDGNDSILIQNYIYNDSTYFEQNKPSIDRTSDLILLYSDLFGKYPFASEKYGHCIAPLGGGMEHQTMTTLINFSFLLVAHELSHQWFGDHVTCSSWQDIWINEGFASYAEYLANQYLESQEEADTWITGAHDYIKSVAGGSVYVPKEDTTDEDRIFSSRLSYKKGAAIIHMMRQEVGNDSMFYKTFSGFLEKYKNSNASANDFKNHLEEITRIEFDQFFNQWYFGQGYPIHHITWNQVGDSLFINSLQTVSSETPFFNVLHEFKITLQDKDTILSFRQTASFNSWAIHVPAAISNVQIDPRHWLLQEFTVTKLVDPDKREIRLKIIPNPAKEKITVQLHNSSGNCSLYLIDSMGKILVTIENLIQNNEIGISQYTPGIYFVIIKDNNRLYPEKFVIN